MDTPALCLALIVFYALHATHYLIRYIVVLAAVNIGNKTISEKAIKHMLGYKGTINTLFRNASNLIFVPLSIVVYLFYHSTH